MWYHSPAIDGIRCEFFVHIVDKHRAFYRRILARNEKYTFDYVDAATLLDHHYHNLIKIDDLPTHVKKAMIKRELSDKVF